MKYLLLIAVLASTTTLGQTRGYSDDTGLTGTDGRVQRAQAFPYRA